MICRKDFGGKIESFSNEICIAPKMRECVSFFTNAGVWRQIKRARGQGRAGEERDPLARLADKICRIFYRFWMACFYGRDHCPIIHCGPDQLSYFALMGLGIVH